MTPEDFEKKMEDLKTPRASGVKEPVEIKLAILNAQRSAAMGIWFVVVPCFFIACVFMKYIFHLNLGLLDTFEETISALDRNPGLRQSGVSGDRSGMDFPIQLFRISEAKEVRYLKLVAILLS